MMRPRQLGAAPATRQPAPMRLHLHAHSRSTPAVHTHLTPHRPLAPDGGVLELDVGAGGRTAAKRWRTLGRVSHESALVMPDNRTVYTTDDTVNGGERARNGGEGW